MRALRFRSLAGWALGLLVTWASGQAAGGPPPTVVLEGGSAFDSATGLMRPFAAIILADGRIKEIVPPGTRYAVPPGTEVIPTSRTGRA